MASPKASRVLRLSTQTINVVVLITLFILLAACGLTPSTGPLADGKAWAATCPKGELGSYQGIDVSGSFAKQQFGGVNEQVLRDIAARTAVCGGHLRVSAFAGTSAQTFELYDRRLSLPGATNNARWRRLPDVVDEVVAIVDAKYEDAMNSGPHSGSDIVGQLRLAAEYADQLGNKTHLAVVLTTDGIQSVATTHIRVESTREAEAFADELSVPELPGELQVVGLGNRTDGKQVASATVELLKAFWDRICARTKADPCSAVTDYTSLVGSVS